jgi:hypothetical protein
MIAALLAKAVEKAGGPADAIQFIDTTDRAAVGVMLELDRFLDLVIPRGGEEFVRWVAAHSRVPVLKHDKGLVHVYVDAAADAEMAASIVVNGWTHAAETVSGASPYTSSPYTWSTSATSPAGHTISVADQAGNTASQPITFVNDVTGPTITAISSGGGTTGLMQAGDTITFTFSEPLNPATVPSSVTVTEARQGQSRLTIAGLLASNVSIPNGYLGGNMSSGTATGTVTLSSGNTVITVTLGTVTTTGSGVMAGPADDLTFVPSSSLTDLVGNSATGSFTTAATFRLF